MSRVKKESQKSNKTNKLNSGNCTVEMAPKSRAEWGKKEEGQCKQEEAKATQDTWLAAKRGKWGGWGGATMSGLPPHTSPVSPTLPEPGTPQVIELLKP